METIAVIDFETTGMAGAGGGRATEIAAVLVREGRIVDRYASLMNSGAYVPPFIERLTGISNEMLADAPPAAQVMQEVARFTGACPLVAHNASFDRSFWQSELSLAGWQEAPQAFACTVLLARRLYPEAANCKLGTLVDFFDLPRAGRAHRALADAMMTAHLLVRMQRDLARRFALELGDAVPDFALLARLQHAKRTHLSACVKDHARQWQHSRQRELLV